MNYFNTISRSFLIMLFLGLCGLVPTQLFAGTWETGLSTMPTPREQFGIGVIDGVIYAVGGISNGTTKAVLEAYDSASDSWTTLESMPTARYTPGVAVVDGILYVIGGFNGSSLAAVEAYDPSTDTWTTKASLSAVRSGPGVGAIDGIIYAVGGYDGSTIQSTAESYNPNTNSWSSVSSMSTGRGSPGAVVANGVLYILGGWDGSNRLSTVEAYDPSTNSWDSVASMNTSWTDMGVGVVNGLVYVTGGWVEGVTDTMEVYDPGTDTWSIDHLLPTERWGIGAGVVNDILYTIGGYNGSVSTSTVEAFDRNWFEQDDESVSYSGSWITKDCSGCSNGTFIRSSQTNATANLAFTGTGIRWIAVKSVVMGIGRVYVDDVDKGTVDLYNSSPQHQVVVFEEDGLSPGVHTITVEVTGNKNPSAQFPIVNVDAFEVIP